ncbi:FlgD immunoglobulin-like domain containing protein [Streptomyces sp. DH8]|uniref:FlgD immunoglobulin-like domain containing protein n=1 Tax=Streptomyces sp. DH8 TaxID=2857008 RepID=UPI001E59B535|nr:FlgD immunoglobulin-like domain containing protein [Streptomyces sp. DH8]
MSRHLYTNSRVHHRRSGRATGAAAVAVALAAGLATALPATAHAEGKAQAAEVLIPAPDAFGEGPEKILATGRYGALHREGDGDYLWTNSYNSRTKVVPELAGVPEEQLVGGHDEHNRAIYTRPRADGGTDIVRIGIEDPAFTSTSTVPARYLNLRFAGGWTIATVDKGDGTYEMRVPRGGDVSADPLVRLPAGATTDARPVVLGAQGSEVLIGYRLADGSPGYGILTAYDGRVKPLPVTGDASSFRITQMTVSWFSRNGSGGQGVRILPRSGTGTPQVVPLATQSPDSEVTAFVVEDNIVWHEGLGGPLRLTPVTGADTERTLLPTVEFAQLRAEGHGGVLALGKDAEGKRAIRSFHQDGSGTVFDLVMREVPKVKTADGEIGALTLDRGRLRYVNSLVGKDTLHGTGVGTGLEAAEGARLADFPGPAAGRFADGTDEGLARLVTDPATGKDALVTGDDPDRPSEALVLPGTGGRILDASPEFVLYEAGGRQYVVDTARDVVVRDQSAQGSVLDGDRLVKSAPNKPGVVNVVDPRTGTVTGTHDIGTDCVPRELQRSGTLLYWSCPSVDAAGVYDTATHRDYPAPTTGVLLGDRFLAAREASGDLRLTALRPDGSTEELGAVTGLKTPARGDGRGTTWTLDPGAGKLAWVGADDAVHVTAPQQAVSPLTVAHSAAPATSTGAWKAAWWLSKPAASWKVTLVRRSTGEAVRTWTGEETRGTVRVAWDGTTASGDPAPAGGYTWRLTAAPADGSGADATASGTLRVTTG